MFGAAEAIAVAGLTFSVITALATSSWCLYFCSRNENCTVEQLKEKRRDLGDKLKALKTKQEEQAVLKGKKQLSALIEEAEAFYSTLSESNIRELENIINARCMCKLMRNVCAVNKARVTMEDKLSELNTLIGEAGAMLENPVKGYKLSGQVKFVGQERRKEIWKEVSRAEKLGIICIHGTVGVGKTAIAISIHNKALKDKHNGLFDYVIWVSVEYGDGLRQVQEKIAERLGIDLSRNTSDSSVERARRLKDILLQKGKFLLVLDSMWQPLSLQEVGIPELKDGRKLIVTSRLRPICNKMNVENYPFETKPLPPPDNPWNLFREKMGVLESLLQKLDHNNVSRTRDVVAGLEGIPLAINKLADTLCCIREDEDTEFNVEWRKELVLAEKAKLDQELIERFKPSYDNLKLATRRCFLYCALLPQDHPIPGKKLIEYWISEGLLDVDNAVEKLHKLVEDGEDILKELRNANLLQKEGSFGHEKFKMLSLVRSMAIGIMATEKLEAYHFRKRENSRLYSFDNGPESSANPNFQPYRRSSFKLDELVPPELYTRNATYREDRIKELQEGENSTNIAMNASYAYTRSSTLVRTREKKTLSKSSLVEEAENMSQKPVKGCRQSPEVAIVGKMRRNTREDIWKAVSGAKEPGAIFIHGTLGVGKTAIAISIHNQALQKEELFDHVIWVNVGYEADLQQVQEAIATSMEIELPTKKVYPDNCNADDIVVERAEVLLRALLQRRKFLLILDDLWQPLSLGDAGIPQLVNGRKMIVTSRVRTICDDICSKEMFEIQPLPFEEEDQAWELFKAAMGGSILHLKSETDYAGIKRALLAELDGLPLAISKLAKRLNPTDFDRAWRGQLDELAREPKQWDQKLFNQFTQSYENLSKAAKQCFLYCASFSKDHPIKSGQLIEYWMLEGLLGDDIETLEKGRENGRKTLKELENAHLLQAGIGENVKMLSLIRSMAIDTKVNEESHEWPPATKKASCMPNRLDDLDLMGKPSCSLVFRLILQHYSLVRSHEELLSNVHEIKVLDLSRTNISTLPSLHKLVKLRALVLRYCDKLVSLPNLSTLDQVIVLDLSGTPLKRCPQGIQKMRKLKRLDLSQTKLATFPPNVVGQLHNLEELLMTTDRNCVWGSSEDGQWKGACVEDLVKLRKLAVLRLHFRDADAFNKYIFTAKESARLPSKFSFRVGAVLTGGCVEENSLAISGLSIDGIKSVNSNSPSLSLELIVISQRLGHLDVSNFSGLSYLFSVEMVGSIGNLTCLRYLRVRGCEEMVDVVQQQPGEEDTICFPQLTRMVLFELPRLKSVCLKLDCPNLVSVEVWGCDNLELPMIQSKSKEIQIIGEGSWLHSLKRHSNPNFTRVEESVPPELIIATTATDSDGMRRGGDRGKMDWLWSWSEDKGNNKPSTSSSGQQTEINNLATTAADRKKLQGRGKGFDSY